MIFLANNQTHEPRKIKPMKPWIKIREIAWTHESNSWIEPMNLWIELMKNQTHESNPWKIKPMNQKREEEGFKFRERKKVRDWQRKKQKNDTNTNKQKSEIACHAHVTDLLFFFFFLKLISSSSSFFNQPNLRASRLRLREIETKRDKRHTKTQTNLGFLAR